MGCAWSLPFGAAEAAFFFPFCGIVLVVSLRRSCEGPDIETPTGVGIINSLIGPALCFVAAADLGCDRYLQHAAVRCESYRVSGWMLWS